MGKNSSHTHLKTQEADTHTSILTSPPPSGKLIWSSIRFSFDHQERTGTLENFRSACHNCSTVVLRLPLHCLLTSALLHNCCVLQRLRVSTEETIFLLKFLWCPGYVPPFLAELPWSQFLKKSQALAKSAQP